MAESSTRERGEADRVNNIKEQGDRSEMEGSNKRAKED